MDDVLAVPESRIGELIEGELVERPRTSVALAAIGREVLRTIGSAHGEVGVGRGWQLLLAPALRFDGDVVVPDIAGWRGDHVPRGRGRDTFIERAPDWACEVLTPTTAGFVRVAKLPVYAARGVTQLWIVDPLQHTVEVLRCEAGRWFVEQAMRGDQVAALAPFGDVTLDAARLWVTGAPGSGGSGGSDSEAGRGRRRHAHESGTMHV